MKFEDKDGKLKGRALKRSLIKSGRAVSALYPSHVLDSFQPGHERRELPFSPKPTRQRIRSDSKMTRLSAGWSCWTCFALALLAFSTLAVAEDGLLVNGDFETPPADGFPDSGLGEVTSAIPSWITNGTVELVEAGQKQGGMLLVVPQGLHAVRLGNDAELSQDIKVEKGSIYSVTFSAARTCAQLESINVSIASSSHEVDLQTLYNIEGWDHYALAFQVESDDERLRFRNTGMEDDPTCGPILDDIAIKKLFTPDKPKDNAVINGDFEEGPWMFRNTSLGVLLPTNLDEEVSSLPGWIVESNRAVRYVDSNHYTVPEGKRGVELLSGKEGIISQMVETTPDKQYSLTFSLGEAGDSCKRPLAVMAFAGDQAESFHYTPLGNASHQSQNLSFTAKAERTRIAFYSIYYNTRTDDKSSLCGPVIDEVKVWGASGSVTVRARLAHGLLGLLLFMYLVFT